MKRTGVLWAICCAMSQPVVGMTVFYVDDDVAGGDGTSWATARADLQEALAMAAPGDSIWVAEGVYTPDPLGDRTVAFVIPDGVSVYGGFPNGGGAGAFGDRDLDVYTTTLSGDLADDDVGAADDPTRADNSLHVVDMSGTGAGTRLDGVTITGGHANGADPDFHGGGLVIDGGAPHVANCRFTSNRATSGGGGLYIAEASPVVTACTFDANLASKGGGIYVFGSTASPKVVECEFTANDASSGGGVYNQRGSARYDRCVFTNNTAVTGGGVSFFEFSTAVVARSQFDSNEATLGGAVNSFEGGLPEVIRSTMTNNSASLGGAIWAKQDLSVVNCLIAGNVAAQGGAFYGDVSGGAHSLINCTIVANVTTGSNWAIDNVCNSGCEKTRVYNSIVRGNIPAQIAATSDTIVTYSNVEGGWAGLGSPNIDDDAEFIDSGAGNYRLKSTSTSVDAGFDGLVPADTFDFDDDLDTSEPLPCDLDNFARFVDGDGDTIATVDMGAYEFEGNIAPTADVLVEQLTDIGADAQVRLDGSGSSDPETTAANLVYEWTVDGSIVCSGVQATCGTIEVALAFGSHDITLRVIDEGNADDEFTTMVTIDPAMLSVFENEKTKAEFDKDPGKLTFSGQIGLPFGVDYTEVGPLAAFDIALGGVDVLAGQQDAFAFDAGGGDGQKWKVIAGLGPLGLRKFDIDWDGATFKLKDFDIKLESEIITSSETVLAFSYKMDKIGGPFSLAIGSALIEIDGSGDATANVGFEVDKPQKSLTVTLPFPLTADATLTFAGAIDTTVPVTDYLKASVGTFKGELRFDPALFPDGSATSPRELDMIIFVGTSGYPGGSTLDDAALTVDGDAWKAK